MEADNPLALFLPDHLARERNEGLAAAELPTVCPAATRGDFADSRRAYIACGVAGDHFAVSDNPMAAKHFCCGEHTACPIWQRNIDEPEWMQARKALMQTRATDRATARQTETGLRADDRHERAELEARRDLDLPT